MIPGISVFERSDGLKDIQRKKYGNIKTIYGTIQTKMYDYIKFEKVIRIGYRINSIHDKMINVHRKNSIKLDLTNLQDLKSDKLRYQYCVV